MLEVAKFDLRLAQDLKKLKGEINILGTYLWLTKSDYSYYDTDSDESKNNTQWSKIIFISIDDALKTRYGKSYDIKDQGFQFKPSNTFSWEQPLTILVLNAFLNTKLVTREQVDSFFYENLTALRKEIRGNKETVETYFKRFMSCLDRFKDVWSMFDYYEETIKKELKPRYIEKGGEFLGCYTDDYNRKRPITSPKYYEERYSFMDELKICIREEINHLIAYKAEQSKAKEAKDES